MATVIQKVRFIHAALDVIYDSSPSNTVARVNAALTQLQRMVLINPMDQLLINRCLQVRTHNPHATLLIQSKSRSLNFL